MKTKLFFLLVCFLNIAGYIGARDDFNFYAGWKNQSFTTKASVNYELEEPFVALNGNKYERSESLRGDGVTLTVGANYYSPLFYFAAEVDLGSYLGGKVIRNSIDGVNWKHDYHYTGENSLNFQVGYNFEKFGIPYAIVKIINSAKYVANTSVSSDSSMEEGAWSDANAFGPGFGLGYKYLIDKNLFIGFEYTRTTYNNHASLQDGLRSEQEYIENMFAISFLLNLPTE